MSRLVVYQPTHDLGNTRRSNILAPWESDSFWKPFSLFPNWDEAFAGDNLKLDLYEKGDSLVVTAALPGVKPEDVNVEEREGILTIQASSSREEESERYGWRIQERRYGSWQRSVRLPVEVKGDKAQAELKDGMLTITLPKVNPEKNPANRIKINLPKLSLPKVGKKERKVKVKA